MQKRDRMQKSIDDLKEIESAHSDNLELIEMGEEEGDEKIIAEAENALRKLAAKAKRQELESLLSGEADSNNAFLEIHPGAGGTESHDWAQMLLRMYIRWAESRDFKVEVMEEQAGEEAGIKSATIRIEGHNAYGWLKTEAGFIFPPWEVDLL